jgi:lambda family phage portal protein
MVTKWDRLAAEEEPQAWTWPAPETVETVPEERAAAQYVQPTGAGGTYSWGGDKFINGFGETQVLEADYWTLRERSVQLFTENLYARGIIRRLVTNEINTGLTLEAIPDASILGKEEEALTEWAEDIENRFSMWARSPQVCDYQGRHSFGALQRAIRGTALIEGDCLVVLRESAAYQAPQVQIISGSRIQTPVDATPMRDSHTIKHGVELDANGRHVRYFVEQLDGTYTPVDAFGKRSGRRVSWLVYGTDKRHEAVRGEPMLALVLQSLKEVDRYRDSVQRKAVINSLIAFFVEKTQDKAGTLPGTGGATRKGAATVTDQDGGTRSWRFADMVPGMMIEELQHGEKIVPQNSQGTDLNFPAFETAIINAVAWAYQIPPEILTLTFSHNYSASQAAINEFRMYLNMKRTEEGENYLQYIYEAWFISSILARRVVADGFLEAWRDPARFEETAAWLGSEWSGAIKPATDTKKQAEGYGLMVDRGWITNERAARELTGTKYRKNVKRIKRENELMSEARGPMPEPEPPAPATQDTVDAIYQELVELQARMGD